MWMSGYRFDVVFPEEHIPLAVVQFYHDALNRWCQEIIADSSLKSL